MVLLLRKIKKKTLRNEDIKIILIIMTKVTIRTLIVIKTITMTTMQ
jgi:hypothetical protein